MEASLRTEDAFPRLVPCALDSIPEEICQRIHNVAVLIEDQPRLRARDLMSSVAPFDRTDRYSRLGVVGNGVLPRRNPVHIGKPAEFRSVSTSLPLVIRLATRTSER